MSRELAGLIRMGKNAFSEADCLRAERHLLEALEGGAKYPDIHYTLGLIDHQRGNYRRAVERFGQAVSLNRDYTEALLSLSITLNDMGRYDEARDAYDRAAEILSRKGGSPGENLFRGRIANLHKELGELYLALGQHDDAIREFRQARSVKRGGRTRRATRWTRFSRRPPGTRRPSSRRGSCTTSPGRRRRRDARGKRRITRSRSTRSSRYT
jgi:tetratricopeptide (TPR) repeat protein